MTIGRPLMNTVGVELTSNSPASATAASTLASVSAYRAGGNFVAV